MSLPYNRGLHVSDYASLEPWLTELRTFEATRMGGLPYRKDHPHREWEYASILQQLDQLGIAPPATILDTGSGASYFPPLLRTKGYAVTVNDSMAYGSIVEWLVQQCQALNIEIPVNASPVEQLTLPDNTFDVTMCISVIEHLAADQFASGLRELFRVTKPGGYLFITSDFFRDEPHALTSPFLAIQHTHFTPYTTVPLIGDVLDVEWVGGMDLTYRDEAGSVNGYSFVNLVMRKPVPRAEWAGYPLTWGDEG